MKNSEPVITYDHMEEEKKRDDIHVNSESNSITDILMLLAEEALVVILFVSMMFLF